MHRIPTTAIDVNTKEIDLPNGRTIVLPENIFNENKENEPKMEWSDGQTKLLIQLYQEKKELVEERKIKSLQKM